VERRSGLPGQHGTRRRKLSERGIQLREKQKVRHIYGILERQFQKTLSKAERRPGIAGENLLQLLEMRLDNVVYRLGFAHSRRQARQLIHHGHITLNGRKTDIPSCLVKVGDVIGWKPESTKTEHYGMVAQEIATKFIPGWLSLDPKTLTGRVLLPPARSDIDIRLDEEAIIAYYSR